jgi:hypothetical protein
VGTAWFVLCPFHSEKTRSCQVIDDRGKYHCYGCGAHGDIMDYWRHTRGHSFQEAIAALASIAGVVPGEWTPRPASLSRPKPEEKRLEPIPPATLTKWHAACATLAESPAEIARIAEWRGIRPQVIEWAARSGLMGSYPYFSQPREAFLVEGVTDAGLIPVSVHVRLGPGTPGNDGRKASWRYDPPGVGSWPFIVGDLSTAAHIFGLEGQWDVLALISIMGWESRWPGNVAAFGLRGATSGSRLFRHTINPHAFIFAFSDADAAGEKWFEPGAFMDQLGEKLAHPDRLHAFTPCKSGSDFNDMVKSGELDRDTLISYIQPTLPQRRQAIVPAFTTWCRAAAKHAEDPAVRAGAAHVSTDKARPGARRPLRVWQKHWSRIAVGDHLMVCLLAAWSAYRADIDRILSSIK